MLAGHTMIRAKSSIFLHFGITFPQLLKFTSRLVLLIVLLEQAMFLRKGNFQLLLSAKLQLLARGRHPQCQKFLASRRPPITCGRGGKIILDFS